jgi:hypothetical protein
LSDRSAYALCFEVLAVPVLAVVVFGLFEDQIDQFLITWTRSSANPVQQSLGGIIWLLALIGWALKLYIPPLVFLGVAALLVMAATYFHLTRHQ